MIDDAQLLRHYVEGRSEEAFTQLVERHLSLVYHSALRQLGGDSHLAQDVAQTVFVLLAEKARSLLGHPSLVGWLHATTHFKVAKALEAGRRRRIREHAAYTMQEILTDSSSHAGWEQIRPVLDEVLLELDEGDRAAVLLRFFEGRAFSDIGAQLRLTATGAHKRVERALDKLHTRLGRRGITSSAAALAALLGSQAGMAAPGALASTVVGAALASAGPAASASTAIEFLTMTKTTAFTAALVGVAGAVGLISIGAGLYHLRKALRAEAALPTVSRQYEADLGRLQTLVRSAEAADKTLAALKKPPDPTGDAGRFLAAFPEARDPLANVTKRQIRRNYGLFYQRAGLTPAQIEVFENRTLELCLQNEAITPDGRSYSTKVKLPDDQLQALLGDAAFRQFHDYIRMMPANNLAMNIVAAAGEAAAPLSPDKAAQLAQIFADNNPAYQEGQPMNLNAEDWTNAQTQARRLLSPSQLKAAQSEFWTLQWRQAWVQAAAK